jgi:tRNA nucleotidyltransferase/poly(A) polymerase
MTRIEEADNFIRGLGVEAYRVGGSVRDEVMGRRPKDADYLVRNVDLSDLGTMLGLAGAKPTRIVARDMAHLGWRAAVRGVGLLEIVLPRTEAKAFGAEGREQIINVDPALSVKQDAFRRDFTFNALYKIVSHPENLHTTTTLTNGRAVDDVLDPLGCGLNDLEHRIIRTTHEDSFRDDPLRTLRALRFVSTIDADLAPETRTQMSWHADAVTGITSKGAVSGTVLDELKKLLMGQCPAEALRIARDTGVLGILLPELAPMLGFDQGSRYHDLTTDEHTFKALETATHVDAPLRVRLALLFHDAGKPASAWVGKDGRKHYYRPSPKLWEELTGDPVAVQEFCDDRPEDHEIASAGLWDAAAKRLNVDKTLRDDVRALILHHMVPTKTKNAGTRVRRMRVKFGDELLRDLLLHRTCDLSGKKSKVALNQIEHIAKLERLREEAEAAGVPKSIKDLEVGGKDAIELGLRGRDIGNALARVLDEVVVDPTGPKLTREWQLARLEALQ